MKALITGVRSELGRVLAQRSESSERSNIHINIAGQQANTLLHDGHAWKEFARIATTGIGRAMRSAQADGAPLLSRRVSNRPAILVRSAQGAAAPPPSIRCRLVLACRRQAQKCGKNLLRHRWPSSFVQAVHGRVRASGRPANSAAPPAVLEASRQGNNSRGTHATSGSPHAASHTDAKGTGMEAAICRLPERARSGDRCMGQLSRTPLQRPQLLPPHPIAGQADREPSVLKIREIFSDPG